MNVPPPTDVPSAEQSPKPDWNRLVATAGCAGVGCATVAIVAIASIVLLLVGSRSTSEKAGEPARRDTAAPSSGSSSSAKLRDVLPSRVGRFQLVEATSLPEVQHENLLAKYASPDGVQLMHQLVLFDSPERAAAEFDSVASGLPAQGFEPESATRWGFQDERGEQIGIGNSWFNQSSGQEIELWTNGPVVALVTGPRGGVRQFVAELPYYPNSSRRTGGAGTAAPPQRPGQPSPPGPEQPPGARTPEPQQARPALPAEGVSFDALAPPNVGPYFRVGSPNLAEPLERICAPLVPQAAARYAYQIPGGEPSVLTILAFATPQEANACLKGLADKAPYRTSRTPFAVKDAHGRTLGWKFLFGATFIPKVWWTNLNVLLMVEDLTHGADARNFANLHPYGSPDDGTPVTNPGRQ